MCRVRFQKHQQCLCECRPVHFQHRSPLIPSISTRTTHNMAIAIEKREMHSRWTLSLYVYASFKKKTQFVKLLAPKSLFQRPPTSVHNLTSYHLPSQSKTLLKSPLCVENSMRSIGSASVSATHYTSKAQIF